jgi:hypothetical protein
LVDTSQVNCVLAWLWLQQLQRWYLKGKAGKGSEEEDRAMKVIKDKYEGLGPMNLHEGQVGQPLSPPGINLLFRFSCCSSS